MSECFDFLCVLKWVPCENLLGQKMQAYGFSPVWDLLRISSSCFCLNVFSHWLHLKGFSPIWRLSCVVIVSLLSERKAQNEHEKGFVFYFVLLQIALYLETPTTKLTLVIRSWYERFFRFSTLFEVKRQIAFSAKSFSAQSTFLSFQVFFCMHQVHVSISVGMWRTHLST